MTPILEVDTLKVFLPGGPQGEVEVLHGVSFAVEAGETVALVGESGSGKSMTARAVMRLLPEGARTSGGIRFFDEEIGAMDPQRLRSLRGEQIGFVFQDPRSHINPVRTVGDFLIEAHVVNRGIDPDQATEQLLGYLRDVAVSHPERRLAQYPHELSGGLLQRMMIASVLAMEPQLIIADEPTTALDVTTQSEVMAILAERRAESGLSILLITHDLELAAAVCDRTLVIYAGWILEEGPSSSLHAEPRHPYTAGLVGSRPYADDRGGRLDAIPGNPMEASQALGGCPFAPRCRHAIAACDTAELELRTVAGGRTACIRADELLTELRTEVDRRGG